MFTYVDWGFVHVLQFYMFGWYTLFIIRMLKGLVVCCTDPIVTCRVDLPYSYCLYGLNIVLLFKFILSGYIMIYMDWGIMLLNLVSASSIKVYYSSSFWVDRRIEHDQHVQGQFVSPIR